MANINFNEGFFEADFVVSGNCSYLGDLICELDKGKLIYGQGCSEPLIIVENITIDKNNIQILGAKKDTLKIVFNGISYMKFKAEGLIKKLNKLDGKISLTVVGRGNVNEWGGKITPQIFIDEIEIHETRNDSF